MQSLHLVDHQSLKSAHHESLSRHLDRHDHMIGDYHAVYDGVNPSMSQAAKLLLSLERFPTWIHEPIPGLFHFRGESILREKINRRPIRRPGTSRNVKRLQLRYGVVCAEKSLTSHIPEKHDVECHLSGSESTCRVHTREPSRNSEYIQACFMIERFCHENEEKTPLSVLKKLMSRTAE